MDRAIAGAVSGKSLNEVAESVANAAGVEAHLEAHATGGELPPRGGANSEQTMTSSDPASDQLGKAANRGGNS